MPTLKVRCPECDATLRQTVEPVEEPTEVKISCLACGHRFIAEVEPETPAPRKPVPRATKKPAKVARRRDDDDEEDDDDRPRRRSKQTAKSNTPLIVGVVVGAILLIGGVVAAIVLSGSGDKNTAKPEPTPKVEPNPPPARPQPTPKQPDGPVRPQPPVTDPNPPTGPVPDDVFARAAGFKPDGPLPELPPLPPVETRPVLTLDPRGHTGFVKHVYFTPDEKRLITVGQDKSLRLWDVASGESLAVLRLPAGPNVEGTPQSAAISPDGKRIAIGVFPLNGGRSGFPLYVLSTETGSLLKVLTPLGEVPTSLDYSPDGRFIAAGCVDGVVQIVEEETNKLVFQVPAATVKLPQLRMNPKHAVLATLAWEKEVTVWSLGQAKKMWSASFTTEKPLTIDWTSDGKLLAIGCTNGEVYIYDDTGTRVKTVPSIPDRGAPIQITRMKFLPGDRQLAFSGIAYLGWAGIIDIETGKRPVLVKDHTNTVMTVSLTRDGKHAVSAGGEYNEAILWNTSTGEVVRKFAAQTRTLWAAGWSKDGRSLAWGAVNRRGPDDLTPLEQTLRLDDFTPGDTPEPAAFQRHVRDDGTFSIKVDDFFSFTVSENGNALYQHKAAPGGNRIYSVSLLPGNRIVVGASVSMYLLDARTGKPIRRFLGDTGLTTGLAPSPDGRYFVSASTDQILRVWSPDQVEPLLSIFAVGREWIAWTPQGYYACSPQGERLIAWQVNNGIDKLPAVYPAVRFRPSMYQPALLKYLIPAGNLQLALAMAAKYDRQAIAAAGLADVLPPGVTVSAPANTTEAEVTVTATAEGNVKNPVVAMRLLLDGRPFQGAAGVQRFTPAQAKVTTTWRVPLTPGSHTVAVLAESSVSKGLSEPVAVTRTGQTELPNLYVLAVGVSEYPGDLKLNYAASDAFLLTSTLKERGKGVFGTIEVRTVTDKQATKRGIMEGLDWLAARMKPKDVGIFSFSGHGTRDPLGRFYLVPVDVNEDDPTNTCLSGDEFKTRLENMPGRLVAILDACHSGAAAVPGKPRPTGARPDNLVRDLLTDDYGVVVMCSSLGRESSLESSATGAGFFTLGLTEGLNGRADINRDGFVFIHELNYYAALRVGQLSGGRQNPTTGAPPTVRPFPIATVGKGP